MDNRTKDPFDAIVEPYIEESRKEEEEKKKAQAKEGKIGVHVISNKPLTPLDELIITSILKDIFGGQQ